VRKEQRALPAYEKPPAWPVDVYFGASAAKKPPVQLGVGKNTFSMGEKTSCDRVKVA